MADDCFLKALAPLKESSRMSIADAVYETFSNDKEYLHIRRPIESELEYLLKSVADVDHGVLIFVCGNVGDGKSHLISLVRQKNPCLLKDYSIYNDATESSSPTKNNIDELKIILDLFSDKKIKKCKEKIILAINLGTLSNFIVADTKSEFSQLKDYVVQMKLLVVSSVVESDPARTDSFFHYVSLCDHNLFHLTDKGPASKVVEEALEKIVSKTDYTNPFFSAYNKNCPGCTANCPIRLNYEMLGEKAVRKKISSLLIQSVIKNHHIVSVRSLYSFIYDLIVPVDLDGLSLEEIKQWVIENPNSSENYIKNLIPNYLFEHPEVSKIFEHLFNLDPALKRSSELDEQIIRLVTSENPSGIINDLDVPPVFKNVLINHVSGKSTDENSLLVKTYVRFSSMILNGLNQVSFEDRCYTEYMKLLYGWFRGDKKAIKIVYNLVLDSVILWNGKSFAGEMLIESGNQQLKYRLGERVSIKPGELPTYTSANDTVYKFSNVLTLYFKVGEQGKDLTLNLDCRMYDMLRRVVEGYRVNQIDKGNFIAFSRFVSDVMLSGELASKIRVTEAATGKHYILARDQFGDFTFNSEVSR